MADVFPHRAPQGARAALAGAALGSLLALGALPAAGADAHKDPFERVNRATFAFNDLLDRMIARPAARAYKAVVPEIARHGISNFFGNLSYPTVAINNALQGKFRLAASDTARFVVNTVVGVGGFGDPATRFGLKAHDEDFGQTLGWWGVPPGPYVVLPLLGPSDFRDAPSRYVDRYANPEHYLRSVRTQYRVTAVGLLDRRAQLLSADEALNQAFDRYALIRNAYQQHREYLVHDGNVPEESYDEPLEDTPSDAPGEPSEPKPQ
jgi:phospholipid-binding lipoprotein MlaA